MICKNCGSDIFFNTITQKWYHNATGINPVERCHNGKYAEPTDVKKNVVILLYKTAKRYCIERGFKKEIDIVELRQYKNVDKHYFFYEYVYVVLNAGMKNQVAERIYSQFIEKGSNAIGHPGKREAVEEVEKDLDNIFTKLRSYGEVEDILEYLETLPWIGPITKYHLARNLGIDVAKPDRHMVRLYESLGFVGVYELCKYISEDVGDRIGTVDVVLWRFCNLKGIDFVLDYISLEREE